MKTNKIMNGSRYIAPLKDEICEDLKTVMNESQNKTERKCAHAILLSHQHRTVDDIAYVMSTDKGFYDGLIGGTAMVF